MHLNRKKVHNPLQEGFEFDRWLWAIPMPRWTDEEIETLREGLLEETLHVLGDKRASEASRKDAWEWINADDVGPFTFRTCCQTAELNWLVLREALVSFSALQKRTEKKLKLQNISQSLKKIA